MTETEQAPPDKGTLAGGPDGEAAFYESYPWCLNPYLTVREAAARLGAELARLREVPAGWQRAEVQTNVLLLGCMLLGSVDDYLRGKTFQLPRRAPALPGLGLLRRGLESLGGLLRLPRLRQAKRWRAGWRPALDGFLADLVAGVVVDASGAALSRALEAPLPGDLLGQHVSFPSAFRKHDLTPHDVLALGRLLMERFPGRQTPILLVGLRTAGSFFVPLLRAQLASEGYARADYLTVRPDRGAGAQERAELRRFAREGFTAAVVDDSPRSGDALVKGVALVHAAGFDADRVAALAPEHPATRDWRSGTECWSLAGTTVLTLPPEQRHKVHLLASGDVEKLLAEYFHRQGCSDVCLVLSPAADELTAGLQATEEPRRARLKRVFEVRLRGPDGAEETRWVLAKSVGWGWLGYHAFLTGRRLVGFVPPVLGLRDGILFSEWLPQADAVPARRQEMVAAAATYVAARARSLGLPTNPLPSLGSHQHHDSFRLLDRILGQAHGSTLAANLARPRIRRALCELDCPLPTLIDGKMDRDEWIAGPAGPLKADYEHHGMGKNELNLVDPAYDLADAVLHLELSAGEEESLLARYAELTGDVKVAERLFLNKLLAGTWATANALKYLFRDPPLPGRQQDHHRHFLRAWHYLTVQAARFCGEHCGRPEAPSWRSPLVVLDVDGVLDRRVFSFPATTAAGIDALALLHAHGCAVAIDTARSAAEVKEYCRAYGLVGGVAEYGGYLWDAVARRGRSLVSDGSMAQLARARAALRRIPGVFLDERHEHSIRAWTYEDRSHEGRSLLSLLGGRMASPYVGRFPAPLRTLAVRQVLAEEELNRLVIRQTTLDTTILPREVDKGSGLLALLSLAGQERLRTVAVGDSEADLPMLRAAERSFAPAHISCARQARAIGCRVARRSYQSGLLEIARAIVHPDGGRCPRCPAPLRERAGHLFLDLLHAADRSRGSSLLRALLDPRAYQFFFR
jgi:hydroxymethylpyrimidine pyrophosphatase-like HAD family hydrolase